MDRSEWGRRTTVAAQAPYVSDTVAGSVRIRSAELGDRRAYDRFVANHPTGNVLQSWAWGELRSRQRWSVIRLLATTATGQIRGAASVLCRQLPVGGSILYLPRGPVLDFTDHRILEAMVTALRLVGTEQRAVFCKIDPYITPPDPLVMRALRARGFVIGHRRGHFDGMQPRFNVIVPLRGGADAVLARCHSKTRYNIRLASKRGVVVRRAGRPDLAIFHRLLLSTCARDGFAERDLCYFQQLWDALTTGGHIELYIASYQGEDIAAGVLTLCGKKAVYAYGASADTHREVMGPYAVQWAMMKRACHLGCTSYDMTGVPKEIREGEPGYGLYRFKRGFWPEVAEFVGEWDLPLHPALYRAWNLVEPAYWGTKVWARHTIKQVRRQTAPHD